MVAFGAAGLDANAIWNDEWYQTRDARSHNEPWEIAIHVAVQNPWHAPAYFITLNWWARLAGWLPFITRALALFMGVLAVAWTYRLGRDHVSPRVGLYAALLIAFGEFFVHYLHETRMYTTSVMLTALVTWFYLRVVNAKREPGFKTYLALWFVVTLTLYTHYFLAIALGAIGIYHLLAAPKNRRWLKITASFLLAGVAFLPWTLALFEAMDRASGRGLQGQMSLPEIANWVSYLFGNGIGVLVPVFIALAGAAYVQWRGKPRRGVGSMLLLFGGVIIGVIVVALTLRVFVNERTRYLIFSWPLIAVLVAIGIVQFGRLLGGRSRAGLVISNVVLVAWMALGTWNNLHPNVTASLPGSTLTAPLHVIMREIRPLQRPGDYIVPVIPDNNPLRRYGNIVMHYVMTERLAADARALGIAIPGDIVFDDESNLMGLSTPAAQAELNQSIMTEIGTGREYVWVAYRTDPVPVVLNDFTTLLQTEYAMCGTAVVRDDYHLNIDEYARSPVCCHPDTLERPPLVDYGNGLTLMGVDIVPGDEAGTMKAFVAWNGGSALPPETYSVALHVLDANGELVAQSDYGLPADAFLCTQPAITLSGLPAGEYTLAVIVYNWQTGERLTGTLDGAQGDRLNVGTFTLDADGMLIAE
jgi:hypothetical protein